MEICFQISTLASESLSNSFSIMCCLIIKDKVWWGSSGEMYGQPLRHGVRQKCSQLLRESIPWFQASQSSPHKKTQVALEICCCCCCLSSLRLVHGWGHFCDRDPGLNLLEKDVQYNRGCAAQAKMYSTSEDVHYRRGYAVQAMMCCTSKDVQYKRGYAVQVRMCSTSKDVQHNRGCAAQAKMCSTSEDVQYKRGRAVQARCAVQTRMCSTSKDVHSK